MNLLEQLRANWSPPEVVWFLAWDGEPVAYFPNFCTPIHRIGPQAWPRPGDRAWGFDEQEAAE